MTRFQKELSGELGKFWENNAKKEIERFQDMVNNGEVFVDENGAAGWNSNGSYFMDDVAEKMSYTTLEFDREATAIMRKADVEKSIARYRANYTGPTEEEMAEMAIEFKGQKVVNILTGRTYQF